MHDDLTSAAPSSKPDVRGIAAVQWDTSYEWRAILLLSLGWGLVGFDRYLILPMFPSIMKSLHLTYADLGKITGVLAITYGLAAFVVGRLSDRIGRKWTMVPALAAFSLLVGLSGLAVGALSLIMIRALMGLTEGAYGPPSLVATMEVAKPGRHGLSLGFYQMVSPLLGFALAPILVTQLMHVINWRYIFFIAAPPGVIVTLLLWRTIREPAKRTAPITSKQIESEDIDTGQFRDVLKYRNVWLAAVAMLAWLTAIIVLTAFLPSYFVDHLKLPNATMGLVMSSVGFGAIIGTLGVPTLSDRFGRKTCLIVAAIGGIFTVIMLSRTSADASSLFLWLMAVSVCTSGLISTTAGPVTIESVPVFLRGTATGVVIAFGEIIGSGGAPIIAGYLAHHFGIASIFDLVVGGLILGLGASFFLHETAPPRTRKR